MQARLWVLGIAALLGGACSGDDMPPLGDGRAGHLEFGSRPDGKGDGDASPDMSFDSAPLSDVNIGELPVTSCEFITPKDGDTIADDQTYVEVQTHNADAGTVVALLVDFVPQKTTVIDDLGKAEFITVPLPAPSDKLVELRAEVRDYPMHKVSCWIHITVTKP